MSIGAAAVIISMFAISWSTSPAVFIFFYSFGFGIATLGYIPAIQCNWKHFPNKKGTVSGIILCGFALGSFVFSFLCRIIVNPHDELPLIKVTHGEVVDHYYGSAVYFNLFIQCAKTVPGPRLHLDGNAGRVHFHPQAT